VKKIQYSRTFAQQVQRSQDQAHALLIQGFPRHQEHDLKYPSSVDLITKKKTNYIPSWIDFSVKGPKYF
jgi:hypothetical protein